MTAKEEAKELYDKYYQLAESIEWTDNETCVKAEKFNNELGSDVLKYWNELAKRSALSEVDGIIAELDSERVFERIYFWNEVKSEIEKID